MKLLTKALAKQIFSEYNHDPKVKQRIDQVINDKVPLDILAIGVEESIAWCLKNLKPDDIKGTEDKENEE
tara:strand:+ start:312 stop:521 length:210 start_codon:yes stop_codon:yes gene_type:complete